MKTTITPLPSPSQERESLELGLDQAGVATLPRPRRYLAFLSKYWWIPLLTVAAAGAGAMAFIMLAAPVFTSSAAMWETEKLHLSEGALFTEDPTTYIGTQIELLKSPRMQQAALERLRAASTNGVPLGKDGFPLEIKLSFKEAPKSSVFVITARSADPAFSQNFLDALMNGYLEYKKSVRKLVSGDTAASISAQVEALERDLKSDEDALAVFERTNNLAILQEEGTIAGGYLEKLQTDLSDLQLESQILQASALEQKNNANAPDSSSWNAVGVMKALDGKAAPASDDTRVTPEQEVAILKLEKARLGKFLRPKHPKVVALDEQIARGEKLIDLFHSQNHDQLVASEGAVKMKIDSVLASIKDWQQKVSESSGRIAEAERLKQNVSRAQSLYDRLATLLQNVDITRNTDLETLAILQPATAAKPSYQLDITVGVLAAVLGLGLGAGIVLMIEKRDDRFTCEQDVNSRLGDSVVCLLPEINRKGKEPLRLLALDDSRHSFAEAYRRLRSALLFLPNETERPKVVLITSAVPGEGKSTVAANLARTLALSGSRVLLVDADLRRGCLHRSLKLQPSPGLAEFLRRACEPHQAMQTDALPNLSFVACGAHYGNPGDLFLGSELDRALAQWRREYDFVIIDSSPLFAADDASCLAPKVDGTLFVVRRGRSGARAVSEALDLLAQRQARVIGVIFNGADASGRSYYYDKNPEYYKTAQMA